MVYGPPLALLQGLVPLGQGDGQMPGLSRAHRGVNPHCALTVQSLIRAPCPSSPLTCPFSVSNLINGLVTVRLSLGTVVLGRGSCVHSSPGGSKGPQERALKGGERCLLYSHVFYTPYTHVCTHTYGPAPGLHHWGLKAARIWPHCRAPSFSAGHPCSCSVPGGTSAWLSLCTLCRWTLGTLGSFPTPWLGSPAPHSG